MFDVAAVSLASFSLILLIRDEYCPVWPSPSRTLRSSIGGPARSLFLVPVVKVAGCIGVVGFVFSLFTVAFLGLVGVAEVGLLKFERAGVAFHQPLPEVTAARVEEDGIVVRDRLLGRVEALAVELKFVSQASVLHNSMRVS